jgi:secreted trypsin-like serine protease
MQKGIMVALLVVFSLLPQSTFAQIPIDRSLVSQRIINGKEISTSRSSVVEILMRSSNSLFLCSGSLLTPRAVLTASHCVSRNPKNMRVVINGRHFAVRQVRVHPQAVKQETTGLILNDVAILTLSKPTNKPKISLLLSASPAANDLVSIFGFGLDQYGKVGILRQGTALVQNVTTNFVATIYQSISQSDTCNGDSGGPAIFRYTDASGVDRAGIIGIISAGTSLDCSVGDLTFYINIQSPAVYQFIQRRVPRVTIQ